MRLPVAPAPTLAFAVLVSIVLIEPQHAHAPVAPVRALAAFDVVTDALHLPRFLVTGPGGYVYVSESRPGRILEIAPDRVASVLIDGLEGPEGLGLRSDGSLMLAAERGPGPDGKGQGGVILRHDLSLHALTIVASGFQQPVGIAVDGEGRLFVSAEGRNGARDERGGLYAVDRLGQAALIAQAFKHPRGILAVTDDDLLVAAERFERGKEAVEGSLFRVDSTGLVTVLISERLEEPFGVARDALDGLYVSGMEARGPGPNAGVILKRRADGHVVEFARGLDQPRGLAFDSEGHLLVVEGGQRRILRFLAPARPGLDPAPPQYTNRTELILRGTAEPGTLMSVTGGGADAAGAADAAGSFRVPVLLSRNAVNSLRLFATAAGGDGLTSPPTDVTVVHDDLLPAVSIASPTAGAILRGGVPFRAAASDESGIALLTLRVDDQTVGVTNMATLTTTIDTDRLADGPHTLSAGARDRAGNEASTSLAVAIDNTPPLLAITAPADGTTLPARTPAFAVAFSDATAGIQAGSFRATLDGSDITGVFTLSADGATATLTTPLDDGPHAFQASIADRAGNVATASATFTVSADPDFALRVAPSTGTLIQGGETRFSVTIVPFNDYANLVDLALGDLPTGMTATWSSVHVAPGSSSVLAVAVSGAVAPGTYPFAVTGTGLVGGRLVARMMSASIGVLPQGVTALTGRIVDTHEMPVPNVSIRLGSLTTRSDGGGNFLLTTPPPGEQVVLIDGSTASTATVSYPTIPVTVHIEPGQVNALGFTPHLHAQPTSRTVPLVPGRGATVADPAIPGLVIQIPEGVTIVGWDGHANTELGVRVVPPDRSPLPPLEVEAGAVAGPIYMFYFGKVGGGTPTAPVPVIGPNDVGGLPGERVDLYFYDEAPDGTRPNRWAKYGTATVSSDGTQLLPDLDPVTGKPYGMPRFCCGGWRAVAPPQNRPPSMAAPNLPALGQGPHGGEPVDLASGLFVLQKTDLVVPGRLPLVFTRTYRTLDTSAGPFGPGTSHSYEPFVQPLSTEALLLTLPGNSRAVFARQPGGGFANTTEPGLRGATLASAPDGSRVLRFKDGATWAFDADGRLVAQRDRSGNMVTLARDGQGRLTAITDPAGRQLALTYDGTSLRVRTVADPLGRTVRYAYDAAGRLTAVTDPAGGVTVYTYDAANRLASITDARGIIFLRNEFDAAGRVSRQTQADGGIWTFAYTLTGGAVTETRLTDPRGNATAYRFNTSGYLIARTDALGQTTQYEREVGTNLLLSTTDPLGRRVHVTYDGNGNVTTATDPDGNSRTFTYEPTYNRLTTATDALGNVTRFAYDLTGHLTSLTDPLGHVTGIAYDAFGQPSRTTDPLGHTTQFDYDLSGNLVAVTDPLGNSSTLAYDPVSRLLQQTDPRGKVTTFAYDALNRLARITDPIGGETAFTYDPNGNLLTVTDARGHTVTHVYDAMDRLSRRIDQVGRGESFTYDALGNLLSTTDRKGQTTTFAYDALNRLVRSTFADGAVAAFTYDAAGRLVQADDAADPHRPIALAYDRLDRLVAETTALGTVAYAYDSLGRRTQMQVNELAPVAYTYDAASRLQSITQAPLAPVTLDHDAAGRRTRLTLPNGVTTEYRYDAASRLTALVYRNATGLLGDLTYTYDAAGNRTGVGGTFARTLLPEPVTSATYDAANRQLAFGDKTMTYDPNGSLTAITEPAGTTTFTWDARNRLIALSGPGIAGSFAYDAFGRRAQKRISGQMAQYHYDGPDVIQELVNGPTAFYLRTLNIDEALVRGEVEFYLTDPLGSIIALIDRAGAVATTYTYAPFGRVIANGMGSGNPLQFTGRENDGIGLSYYRARYYSPTTMRFLSEDPLGPIGGINRYTYVANNPLRYVDRAGLIPGIPEIPDGLDNVPEAFIAVVYAEAARQSFAAKLAVANVVRNRVQDTTHEFRYLNTYEQVIFQRNAFEAVSSRLFTEALQVLSGRKPRRLASEERGKLTEAFHAAQAAYHNRVPDTTGGSLFFYSPFISRPSYITRGLEGGTLEQFSPPGVDPNDFLFYRYVPRR